MMMFSAWTLLKRTAILPLLLLPLLLRAETRPVARYCFEDLKDGVVPNRMGPRYPARIKGKFAVTKNNALAMDGLTTEIVLEGTEKLDPLKGMTFMLTYKQQALPGNRDLERNHDMFFFRSKQFLFGRQKNRIYTNFWDDSKHDVAPNYAMEAYPQDGDFHHAAMTIFHRLEPAHGVDQVEIRVYIDGAPVKQIDHRRLRMRFCDDTPIELGCGSTFGPPWRLGGEIADARIYDRVLTGNEIRRIVASQKLAKPAFRTPAKLSSDDEKLLSSVENVPFRSALSRLAAKGLPAWRQAAQQPEKHLLLLEGKETSLVVSTIPGASGIVSWFDKVSRRELLRWDNLFFELVLNKDGREETFSPDSPGVEAELTKQPRRDGGAWRFTVDYTHPDWKAAVSSTYPGDRIEYGIMPGTRHPVTALNAPRVSISALNRGKPFLVTPDEIGRALPCDTASGAAHTGTYPGRRACVQMGAYYDGETGVFLSSGEPRGRISRLSMTGDASGAEFGFRQSVARDGGNESRAVIELFRGDWFDAGVCYRNMLDRLKPVWWTREAFEYPTPRWLKDNTLWLTYAYGNESHDDLAKLRKYFGLSFAVNVEGSHDRGSKYIPWPRLHPDMISDLRELHAAGIRVQLYTNARIVQEIGRSMTLPEFNQKILPDAVRQEGKPVFERYPDTFGKAAVICPSSRTYSLQILDFCRRFASQGLDGIYLDQLGCTTPILCTSKDHLHAPLDPDAWFLNGQRKTVLELRRLFKEKGWTDRGFSNECNGEIVVGLSDIATPRGAMYDDQIPLFHQIYAGRIQNGDINRVGEDEGAGFVKDAEELLRGEQLGRLYSRNLTSPLRFDYRANVKRLMHLRTTLLDYFNGGEMARPPRQEPEPQKIPHFWGVFGSRVVSRPSILAACWRKGENFAVIAVNTTGEPRETTLCFTPDSPAPSSWTLYTSDGKKHAVSGAEKMRFPCRLGPYACLVLTNAPGPKLDRAFETIAATFTEKDPFRFDPAKYPEKALVPDRTYPAVEAFVSGAQRAVARNEINYIYYAVVYPGTMDFGGEPKTRNIDLLMAAPPESGDGTLRIYVDSIAPENLVCSSPLCANFHTANWRDYRMMTLKFTRPLSGKHRIFFCFSGSSVCNLRTWKIL